MGNKEEGMVENREEGIMDESDGQVERPIATPITEEKLWAFIGERLPEEELTKLRSQYRSCPEFRRAVDELYEYSDVGSTLAEKGEAAHRELQSTLPNVELPTTPELSLEEEANASPDERQIVDMWRKIKKYP